jgi:hypothetical protein
LRVQGKNDDVPRFIPLGRLQNDTAKKSLKMLKQRQEASEEPKT